MDPGAIDWSKREDKRVNDASLMCLMKPSIEAHKYLNCLSFPADQWIFEQGAARFYPGIKHKFIGVERDPTVNKRAAHLAGKLMADPKDGRNFTMEMLPSEISFRRALTMPLELSSMGPDEPFNLVYADYMGAWSPEKFEDICFLLDNDRVFPKLGTFVMTLSLGHNRSPKRLEAIELGMDLPQHQRVHINDNNALSRLKKGRPSAERLHALVHGIVQTIVNLAEDYDKEVKAHPVNIYYNPRSTNGAKMYAEGSFSFTRVA